MSRVECNSPSEPMYPRVCSILGASAIGYAVLLVPQAPSAGIDCSDGIGPSAMDPCASNRPSDPRIFGRSTSCEPGHFSGTDPDQGKLPPSFAPCEAGPSSKMNPVQGEVPLSYAEGGVILLELDPMLPQLARKEVDSSPLSPSPLLTILDDEKVPFPTTFEEELVDSTRPLPELQVEEILQWLQASDEPPTPPQPATSTAHGFDQLTSFGFDLQDKPADDSNVSGLRRSARIAKQTAACDRTSSPT